MSDVISSSNSVSVYLSS